MEIEILPSLSEKKICQRSLLLRASGLEADNDADCYILIYENGRLLATGARKENILKCIAVDEERKGEGLTATLLTELRKNAFENGYSHLFLYTNPKNRIMFESLFFYPVAETENVLLMENKKDGINSFLTSLKKADGNGNIGAVVMNCNPFTLGHRYLIEKASNECDALYVFVLSEDKSKFAAKDRLEMVKRGTADIRNVCVLPTGPYLISSVTFPTYFLKNRDNIPEIHCRLDIEIFAKYFVPRFGITKRFTGTEPLSRATEIYNRTLSEFLPKSSVEYCELERLEIDGCTVSASRVRGLLEDGDITEVKKLVPKTTFDFLCSKGYIKYKMKGLTQ